MADTLASSEILHLVNVFGFSVYICLSHANRLIKYEN